MMPLPKEPAGKTRKSAWFKLLWRAVRGNRIIAGDNIIAEHKPEGTVLHAKAGRGGARVGSDIAFKGDWDHTESYIEGDIVYFKQGYPEGATLDEFGGGLAPYNLQSFLYPGTWKALEPSTAVAPGTSAAKWERFAYGPTDTTYIVNGSSGADAYTKLTGYQINIAGVLNPADGTDGVTIQHDGTNWLFEMYAESGSRFLIGSSLFTGFMTVRTIYVAQDGALYSMQVLGTAPVLVPV